MESQDTSKRIVPNKAAGRVTPVEIQVTSPEIVQIGRRRNGRITADATSVARLVISPEIVSRPGMIKMPATGWCRNLSKKYTVEPVLKDHPTDHKNVVCQDRWSLVTASIMLKCKSFCQNCVVCQDRWFVMAVVSQDRFHRISMRLLY